MKTILEKETTTYNFLTSKTPFMAVSCEGSGDLPLKERMHANSGNILHVVLCKEDRKMLNTINNKLDKLLKEQK